MSESKNFCPKCGTPHKPGAKFCGKCGMQFEEKSTAEQALKAVQGVSKTAQSVESTVSQAGAAIRTAGQVKDFMITPPAQWKVVIGDRLPDMGEAAVNKAEEMVVQKARETITTTMEDVVKDTMAKSPGKETGKEIPVKPPVQDARKEVLAPPPVSGQVCPSCGTQVKSGAKFCGSCGAAVPATPKTAAPTCPNCGSPVRNGAKFCGTCGKKI